MQSLKLKRAKAMGRGAAKIRAGNAVLFTDKARKAASDLKARNAYREACGLPIIQASQK